MKFASWRTFWIAVAGTSAIVVSFAALPVLADLDLHTDQYCLYDSEKNQVTREGGYGCELNWRSVFDYYIAWIGIAATLFYTALAIVIAWIAIDTCLRRRRGRRASQGRGTSGCRTQR